MAEELPSASLLLIGDVAGGEHVGSEQSGQGSGVHFVRFHLRLCEEPCLVGVGENDVEAVFLEPVVDLDPQVSRGLRARRFPHMIGTAIPIIFIIMIQYVLLVGWIKKKIDVL